MKKRLLFGTDILFGENSGEISHVIGVLNELQRYFEITIFTFKECLPALQARGLRDDILIERSINYRGLSSKLIYFFKFYSYFRANGFDTVYVRHSLFARILGSNLFKFNCPLMTEYNGVIEFETASALRKIVMRGSRRWLTGLANKSKCNISVAEGVTEYYSRFNKGRWVTIHNGVSEDIVKHFRGLPRKKNNNFIFVGNIARWQDFNVFFDFLQKNAEWIRAEGMRATIVGDGSCIDLVKAQVKSRKLEDMVFFPGVLTGAALLQEFENAHYGVLVDTRVYKGDLLFSPLKFYEYEAAGLYSLYFSRDMVSFPGVVITSESLIYSSQEEFDTRINRLNSGPRILRSWREVCQDIVEKALC